MVVVRNVFRLKFGKAREALAILKEGTEIQKRAGMASVPTRILTDMTGPFYTIVMELSYPTLAEFETTAPRIMADKDWQANYQKFAALIESGEREIFRVVEA